MKSPLLLAAFSFLLVNSFAQESFLSGPSEFYINSSSYNPLLAGIRNNEGHPVLNSKNGGNIHFNRDVEGDTYIESKSNGTSFSIASFLRSGMVGIGTANPVTKLHVTSLTSGDAVLRLEADIDNNNEADNPRIELLQDGNAHGAFIGFNYDWSGTSTESGNRFRIVTRSQGVNDYDNFVIVPGSGFVGIGTETPKAPLSVNGQIRATEVKVQANVDVPDYVFDPGYELRTLKETKEFIAKNKHLPEIPSAAEIGLDGIDLGDMNMKLLKKIEELTLYQIELLEELEKMKKRLEYLEKKN